MTLCSLPISAGVTQRAEPPHRQRLAVIVVVTVRLTGLQTGGTGTRTDDLPCPNGLGHNPMRLGLLGELGFESSGVPDRVLRDTAPPIRIGRPDLRLRGVSSQQDSATDTGLTTEPAASCNPGTSGQQHEIFAAPLTCSRDNRGWWTKCPSTNDLVIDVM